MNGEVQQSRQIGKDRGIGRSGDRVIEKVVFRSPDYPITRFPEIARPKVAEAMALAGCQVQILVVRD